MPAEPLVSIVIPHRVGAEIALACAREEVGA
jgi:hypothetical protein